MAEPLVIEVRVDGAGQASAALRSVRGEVSATAGAIDRTGRLASGGGSAGLSRMEEATNRLRKAASNVNTHLNAMSRWLGSELVSAARRGVIGIGLVVAAVAGFGLKAASNFQQARLAFDTLLGSADAGKQLFDQLQKINLTTPFQLGEIAPATQLLLRYGVAGQQVIPVLKSLLDAAALSGDPANNLQKLSLAVGQVVQKGKVEGQEARQLAEAGIDVYGLMATQLGVTRQAALDLGQAGKLSSSQFVTALEAEIGPMEKLRGGAQKMSQTLLGQLSNLKDAVNIRLADASAPLVDELTKQIPAITAVVGTAVDQLGPPVFRLVGLIASGLTHVLPIVAPLLAVLVDGLGRLLTASGPALDALQPLSGEIGQALVEMVDALVPVMPDLVGLLVAIVKILPDFIRLLTDLIPVLDGFARLTTSLLGYEPVRKVLAGLLVVLIGYRALSSVVTGLWAFAAGLRAIAGAQTEANAAVAAGGAGGGGLGVSNRTGLGIGLTAAAAAQAPGVGNSIGQDLGFLATTTGAGAAFGGLPGAAGGAAFGVGAIAGSRIADLFLGDVDSNLARSSRVHSLATGMTPGRVPVTSTVRNYAVSGASSGHVRGTAWDAHPDFPQSYANNIRALGGFASVHDSGFGRHVHAQIGDSTPTPRSSSWPGGDGMPPIVVSVGNVYGQVDLERGIARGVEQGLERKKRRDVERGHVDRMAP